MSSPRPAAVPIAAVLVAALGYLVDVYDLILFNVVRHRSVLDIGVAAEDAQSTGIWLLNLQLAGMLLGGILWGTLGDALGRVRVLFGSILLYSVANLLNAYVGGVGEYAVLRFVAGVGLAGELGAGVTLVSELMGKRGRGWGVTVIGAVGVVGAVLAGVVGDQAPGLGRFGLPEGEGWRTAYLLGGVMGLALLVLRIGIAESGMFAGLSQVSARRGLRPLLSSGARLRRYVAIILVGAPIWYTLGILIGLAPQLGAALGLPEHQLPRPGACVALYYAGAILGDLASGTLSQLLRARREAILAFMVGVAGAVALLLFSGGLGLKWFYACVTMIGFFSGYWIVMITTASEQFGTNLRATVTTTVPNMVRASAIPMTMAFDSLSRSLGHQKAAGVIAVAVFSLAVFALRSLPETYGRDLDFTED